MKKIAIIFTTLIAVTSTFAATQSTTSALYPMDSFNPNKFSASNLSEFSKRYVTEATAVIKKGEFETTADYEARIAKGFKIKSLDSDKIYAFKIDSLDIKYNPDNSQYEVKNVDSATIGKLFGSHNRTIIGLDKVAETTLRIGKLNRLSDQYKASNAYGKTATVYRLRGKDLYFEASRTFTNVFNNHLTFPTPIDVAKRNASCDKQVYVFGKLNGKPYKDSSYDYAAIAVPKINNTSDIQVTKLTIPMNIVGMVLKCSKGTVLSVYEQSEIDSPRYKNNSKYSLEDDEETF
jgi:hypothetical protein